MQYTRNVIIANETLRRINTIRQQEKGLGLSEFQRGQMSGAQQTLAWLVRDAMEPIRAILTDEQLAQLDNTCYAPGCIEQATWLFREADDDPIRLCDNHIGEYVNEARRPYTHTKLQAP